MTLTFFGRNISPSSTAGKLVLYGTLPLLALTAYTCYLSTIAIGAVLHVHPVLVFLVLFALSVQLTFDGRTVGLLPGKYTRDALGWACFAISLYHYIRLDMRWEVVAVSASMVIIQVGRFVKLVQEHREDKWRLQRAIQQEMVDLKYGNRSEQ
jgi:hypothetical protein